MIVRSVPGLLSTVLAVCAIAALGLTAVRPAEAPLWVDGLDGVAGYLVGWRVAVTVLALGVGTWLALAATEAVTGSAWAVRLAVVGVVVAAPFAGRSAETVYWDARGLGTAWRVEGRGPTLEGTWRGVAGGACGYGAAVRLDMVPDGTGTGVAVPMNLVSPLTTAMVALSPLHGPHAIAVEARMTKDGRIEVWGEPEGVGSLRIVHP